MRMITSASIAMALALILGPTAGAQVPGQDSVNGSGTFDQSVPNEPGILSVIDARSGPSGENPTGQVDITIGISLGRTTFHGDVTCLTVTGNTAVLSGPVPNPVNLDVDFVAAIEDNAGSAQPDRVAVAVMLNSTPTCPDPFPGPFGGLTPLLTGDFKVHDAHPLPTATDQCKHGGWRSFGVFKNQGDCVSFVATAGKKPPGSNP